jgi:transcriptional regulator with XRE-family HTH domain
MLSKRKTTVAALRNELGISAEKFAKLIGKSVYTVHKLESGVLALSEETAHKIQQETAISMTWLLRGDPNDEPYYEDEADPGQRHRWVKRHFELVQAAKGVKIVTKGSEAKYRAGTIVRMLAPIAPWLGIYAKAEREGKGDLALYLLQQSLKNLEKRLGRDDKEAAASVKKTRIVAPDGSEWAFKLEADQISLTRIKEA